jgi:hypothetical protein
MSKDWLRDGGGNSSERRMKSRDTLIMSLLVVFLCVVDALSLTEAKDHRQAHKGAIP